MLRKFLIVFAIFLLPLTSHAAFPRPTGFVNDFASVIDPGTQTKLETMLVKFEQASGNEVVVATLPSLEGRTVEDVAVDLYKQWGIGKKDRDNGVLFLVAPSDRKMRIEVGYGLEGAVNDALAGRIIDENVLPNFRAGKMSDGIAAGTVAIVSTIAAKEGIAFDTEAAYSTDAAQTIQVKKKSSPIMIVFKVLFFLFMAILFIKNPWLFLLLISSSGRGGGGGFGGGFGGFGGGLSGGGGASRSW